MRSDEEVPLRCCRGGKFAPDIVDLPPLAFPPRFQHLLLFSLFVGSELRRTTLHPLAAHDPPPSSVLSSCSAVSCFSFPSSASSLQGRKTQRQVTRNHRRYRHNTEANHDDSFEPALFPVRPLVFSLNLLLLPSFHLPSIDVAVPDVPLLLRKGSSKVLRQGEGLDRGRQARGAGIVLEAA